MFKQFFKTLFLGLTSGAACAAGGWLWKNHMEGKANELTQKNENQERKDEESVTDKKNKKRK